ncbi:MAG TPA: Uma2 family endonuclease [Desulfuromonadales bacterium]|nr:Uma2 family endonuclease [Desulfuromonadales bacterium]
MTNLKRQYPEPYTYQEYEKLPEGVRLEIIDGVVYDMAPSPVVKHQVIVLKLATMFEKFFIGKPCKPFVAPLDVVLDDINVVEPDVFVVCDPEKITEKNIKGAPDLVIEVLSPSNIIKDRRTKKWLYEQHRVQEFIIISPMEESAERYWLVDGKYGVAELFNWDESFYSKLFPDLYFDLRVIFEKEHVVSEPDPAWLVQARLTYPDMP